MTPEQSREHWYQAHLRSLNAPEFRPHIPQRPFWLPEHKIKALQRRAG